MYCFGIACLKDVVRQVNVDIIGVESFLVVVRAKQLKASAVFPLKMAGGFKRIARIGK
jgi:hypothetical protein